VASITKFLKTTAQLWGFKNWKRWATQGFRRGVAAEVALRSEHLAEILETGDWSAKSRAYLRYIAAVHGELEARAVAGALAVGEEEASDDEAAA